MQAFNATLVGFAAKAVGVAEHAPAPAPDPVTVIGTLETPSVAVTVLPVNTPDGLVRLMDRIFPLTVAVTPVLFEEAL